MCTPTGRRQESTAPNLQQLPLNSPEFERIKRAIHEDISFYGGGRSNGKSWFWKHWYEAREEYLAEQRRVAQYTISTAVKALVESYRK